MVVMEGGGGGGLMQNFECSEEGGLPKSNKCEQGGRGSKFWSFFEDVITE